MKALSYEDVRAAAARIDGRVRRVPVVQTDVRDASPGARMFLALEFMQHTGTFKDRGAQNFIEAHREAGRLPTAGVAIASGGNAGLACAWSAAQQGIPATVFVPTTAPAVKVARLRAYGARVEQVGTEYAQAFDACRAFAESSGALMSHAYDHPLIAAGAGTLVDEIRSQAPDLDTIVLAVGGGGLLAGVATAASHHGIRTVAVEPTHCRSLNAAIEAGRPVDVSVRSVAADALGARRVSDMAYLAARHPLVSSILVDDEAIVGARRQLWRDHRLAVEHGAATAFAGVVDAAGYRPAPGERVCVVLCGANTDPRDVAEE